MKKFNQYLQKYLVYGLPLIVIAFVWEWLSPHKAVDPQTQSFLAKAFYEITSWNVILWFVSLMVFMVMLLINKESQEQSVKFLAGIKERDEREQLVTGIAARTSFVATTSLLIFLLFVSSFTLSLAKNPDASIDGKASSLTFNFAFETTDVQDAPNADGVTFERKGMPLSKQSLILLILIWQIAAFRIKVRKELGAGEI